MRIDVPAIRSDISTPESREFLLKVAHAMRKKSLSSSLGGRLCLIKQQKINHENRRGLEISIFSLKARDTQAPVATILFKRRSLFALFSEPDIELCAFIRPLSTMSITDIRKAGDTESGRSGLRRKLLPAIDQWHNLVADAHEVACSR